jgi:hypothetical protein
MQPHATANRRLHGLTVATVLCAVVVAHCASQFVLYRGRVISGWRANDFVVFGIPALAACVAYGLVLRFFARTHVGGTVFGALGITFFSFWVAMVWSLNTYGS